MSRNRFQLIMKFLHFNDNEAIPANNQDNLYKVRPVIDALVPKCRDLYTPNENVSIDEGMLRWKGRLTLRVYNPMKPIKYGIKSYVFDGFGHILCKYLGLTKFLCFIIESFLLIFKLCHLFRGNLPSRAKLSMILDQNAFYNVPRDILKVQHAFS
jgi:hypothetical protein